MCFSVPKIYLREIEKLIEKSIFKSKSQFFRLCMRNTLIQELKLTGMSDITDYETNRIISEIENARITKFKKHFPLGRNF